MAHLTGRIPLDQNRRNITAGVSTVNGTSPVPIEVDPATGLLQVSVQGGIGATQYTTGNVVPVPIGTVTLGKRVDNSLHPLKLDTQDNLFTTLADSNGNVVDVTGTGLQVVPMDSNGTTPLTVLNENSNLAKTALTDGASPTFGVAVMGYSNSAAGETYLHVDPFDNLLVNVQNSLIPIPFDELAFSDADANGNYQAVDIKTLGTTHGTLTISYDANSQITDIKFTAV